jgi:hypothetical protein
LQPNLKQHFPTYTSTETAESYQTIDPVPADGGNDDQSLVAAKSTGAASTQHSRRAPPPPRHSFVTREASSPPSARPMCSAASAPGSPRAEASSCSAAHSPTKRRGTQIASRRVPSQIPAFFHRSNRNSARHSRGSYCKDSAEA